MTFSELEMEINDKVEEMLAEVDYVSAEKARLDRRCGPIYINEEFIATTISNDRSLQYYGGFEYVDSEHRFQFGGMVFYTADSDRVLEHIELYLENHGK